MAAVSQTPAGLLLVNANIVTLDPARPYAGSIAVRSGRILWIDDEGGGSQRRGLRVLDCRGRTLLPGFHDAHGHLRALAESLSGLDLRPADGFRSIADIQTAVRSLCLRSTPGGWIRGRGYHEFDLAEKRHPSRWDLDAAAPHHPVKLTHRSGHAHVLNSRGLERVEITLETADPPGGLIDRDIHTGEPTGLLYEMGAFLSGRIPPVERSDLERGVRLADEDLLSHGITSIQDASFSNGIEQWEELRSWKDCGLFRPRIHMMLGFGAWSGSALPDTSHRLLEKGSGLNGVKIVLDSTTGRLHPLQGDLDRMVLEIHRAGFQAAIHAVEEDAVSSACAAIEGAIQALPKRDHRHRIEHCSVCRPPLARRLAALGIRVVTQPGFVFHNGDRYLATVPGESLDHLYPIGTLIREGVRVAAGSDFPLVCPNPLLGIHGAVARKSAAGRIVAGNQAIPNIEAVRMHTLLPAETCFEEDLLGTLAPGKLADIVVLNGDPTTASCDEIPDIEVEMTILNGEIVWEKSR